jgi:hypothetical protein
LAFAGAVAYESDSDLFRLWPVCHRRDCDSAPNSRWPTQAVRFDVCGNPTVQACPSSSQCYWWLGCALFGADSSIFTGPFRTLDGVLAKSPISDLSRGSTGTDRRLVKHSSSGIAVFTGVARGGEILAICSIGGDLLSVSAMCFCPCALSSISHCFRIPFPGLPLSPCGISYET